MRARAIGNVVAGGFLLLVAIALGSIAWSLLSGPDEIDTGPLVDDLEGFEAPAGSQPSQVVVTGCTGEGSFPAYAETRFVVDEGSLDEARAGLESQAKEAGWVPHVDAAGVENFVRNDRNLYFRGEDSSDGSAVVVLHVETSGFC